ncbi:MAG: hypothetical protein RI591_02795 [Dehalococcoidia bacterium]|nr:hypothetical protein [Dehalococcoidia bacterium]
MQKSSGWLFAMVFAAIAFILEAAGSAMYVPRLRDDWVGIGLYITASLLFAIATFGFYLKWTQERRKEKQERSEGK